MTLARLQMGAAGELAALRYLRRRGLRLVQRNCKLGQAGELDLVMSDRGVLVFVEVKAMLAGESIRGLDHLHAAKQRKLIQLATLYLQRSGGVAPYKAVRFDAVEVEFPDATLRRPQVRHIPDAFRA